MGAFQRLFRRGVCRIRLSKKQALLTGGGVIEVRAVVPRSTDGELTAGNDGLNRVNCRSFSDSYDNKKKVK